jgi:hypothetical protein
MNFVEELQTVLRGVETELHKLIDQVANGKAVADAKQDVTNLVVTAKQQATLLGGQLVAAAGADAQKIGEDAYAVAREAAQGVDVPLNNLPADQRPDLPPGSTSTSAADTQNESAPTPVQPSQTSATATEQAPATDVPAEQPAPVQHSIG